MKELAFALIDNINRELDKTKDLEKRLDLMILKFKIQATVN